MVELGQAFEQAMEQPPPRLDSLGEIVLEPFHPERDALAVHEALEEAFGEFYRRGESRCALGVDANNTTGATRLYERAGMRVLWEAVIFEKELVPA